MTDDVAEDLTVEEALRRIERAIQDLQVAKIRRHEANCDEDDHQECYPVRGVLTDWIVTYAYSKYDDDGDRQDYYAFGTNVGVSYHGMLGLIAQANEMIVEHYA